MSTYDRHEIEDLVRRIVARVLQQEEPAGRPILDAAQVQAAPEGSLLPVAPDAIITPLARQTAWERRIQLAADPATAAAGTAGPVVALGADHGGYQLKEQLKPTLEGLGYSVIDCGTHSAEAVDYPDFAYAVAQYVSQGRAALGIIVDGAGIGSCMTANKVPGVRAALCYDQATAANSREHNHANVLTLGAGMIGLNLARQIVTTWLNTPYGAGRHARRVDKITQIEQRFLKKHTRQE